MTLKDFEIDSFAGDGERKGYLIYVDDVREEANRLRAYTDQTLYLDATMPRLDEPNYEVWLMRLFNPGINSHVTFGMVLLPREFLYSIKYEAKCLEKAFTAITGEFSGFATRKFMLSTKRNIHFLMRA